MINRVKNHLKNPKNRINIILKMSISASLASLGIVLSTIVVFVPNMEFISVTIFLVSILFGVYYGLMVAVSVSVVYEFIIIAIIGSAGYLIFFKLICYVSLAVVTGLMRKIFLKLSYWELGVFGSFFAIIYDIITTIGYQIVVISTIGNQTVVIGSDFVFQYLLVLPGSGIIFPIAHVVGNFVFQYLLVLLGSGIIFTIAHVVSNFVLFSFTKTMINWIYSAFKARGIKQLMIPSIYDEETTASIVSEGGKT